MSGVYKCKLRRRIPRPRPRLPEPSKEVIEPESVKETPVTKEEPAPSTKEVNPVKDNLNTKPVEVHVERSISQEQSKRNGFYVFKNEPVNHTTIKRNIYNNPLLHRRL